jgi:hypothetical protein
MALMNLNPAELVMDSTETPISHSIEGSTMVRAAGQDASLALNLSPDAVGMGQGSGNSLA